MKEETPRRTFTEYLGRLWCKYSHTTARGCKVYVTRTERGKQQFRRIWAKRYPYLFTKEYLRSPR